jgi:hypothetical protein
MQKPSLGFGLGLRTSHFQHILDHLPAVDWFEALSENYMVAARGFGRIRSSFILQQQALHNELIESSKDDQQQLIINPDTNHQVTNK